jgi:hypothetical protein
MTQHRLTYEPQYRLVFDSLAKPKKAPTGLACVDCTCGLNICPAPVKEAWHIFVEHGVQHAGLSF